MQVGFLGMFAGCLRHTGYCFSFTLRLLDFLQEHFGHIEISVQIVINLLLYKVAHEFINTYSAQGKGVSALVLIGCHVKRAQFDFCLTLEQRFDYADGHGGY